MILDGPVIGCRVWRYSLYLGVNLQGILYGKWHPGVNTAQCSTPEKHARDATDEVSPAVNCGCGLHAYHDWNEGRLTCLHPRSAYISGIVRGWGQMRIHPDGWRAQYAEVLAFVTGYDEDVDYRVKQLVERYKVPSIPVTAMPDIVIEFGDVVPQPLRPRPKRSHGQDRSGMPDVQGFCQQCGRSHGPLDRGHTP